MPMTHAAGSFDVALTPTGTPDKANGISLGRMTIAKRYHGPLDASATGQMLTAMMDAGAAAYVAIERVTGTLAGRTGSFAMTHRATMDPSGRELVITIVPGSGTGGLAGIAGTMTITIEGDAHAYDLEYELPSRL